MALESLALELTSGWAVIREQSSYDRLIFWPCDLDHTLTGPASQTLCAQT
jgi:hypothetical protein